LQARDSTSAGHAAPLPTGWTRIERERVWRPPPHVAEHASKSPNSLTTQSTGHGSVLHDSVSTRAPHVSPPGVGVTTIERDRDRVPPPHAAEQSENSPKGLNSQSIPHAKVLHGRASESAGQAAPPFAGSTTMVRVRDWVPPSQAAEHSPKGPNALTTQSVGHAGPLHEIDSTNAGHAAPPCAGWARMVRVRVCVPAPSQIEEEH